LFGKGEGMDKEFHVSEEREKLIKEHILDDTFKKAEMNREKRNTDKSKSKKTHKTTFPKLVALLIIFAILGLIISNVVPWIFINFNAGYGDISLPIYSNFNKNDITYQEINDLFNTQNYIGIKYNDFSTTPTFVSYGFISLIILAIALTIFLLIDKFRHFSTITFTIFHFIIASLTVVSGIFIAVSVLKYFGVFFLKYYNSELINFNITFLIFPAAFILVVFGLIIVKIAFMIMRMDLGTIQNIYRDSSEKSFSRYTRGGDL
jgi:hypothetical protein